MESLRDLLKGLAPTCELTAREREQLRVDSLNQVDGELSQADGYHCSACRNRGYSAVLKEGENELYSMSVVECRCMEVRRSIRRMKASGLKDIITDYTFAKYEAGEGWQQAIRKAAEEYAREPKGWFFIGGQSGAGKTHICTAICREFLLRGMNVAYMLWRDDVVKMNSMANDSEEYGKMMDRYKKAQVLYIDDLFKTGKKDGVRQMPTPGDINRAFELINYRYNDPKMLTIISSECTADEILEIDEAVGGRIFERAKVLNLAKDRKRNYRLRGAVEI